VSNTVHSIGCRSKLDLGEGLKGIVNCRGSAFENLERRHRDVEKAMRKDMKREKRKEKREKSEKREWNILQVESELRRVIE